MSTTRLISRPSSIPKTRWTKMVRLLRYLTKVASIREFSLSSTILHLDYLKEHRKGYHTTLLMEGTLNQRLCEIDNEAKTMVENIISRLADERGIDENLKARDMLRWVAEMNNIKVSAEEIVLREVVYV